MSTPYYQDELVTLYHGDALTVARGMESESVNCIVTSPPYFGLRDYGEDGQLGAEASVCEYVENMVALFSELRRVLADDGTLWLNLGDSYGAGKNLVGGPWRVALALQSDGWILRSEIIWAKSNPMPESVTDRPTKSHETIFLFVKSPRYYYDAAAIAEESDRSDKHSRFGSNKASGMPENRIHSGNTWMPSGTRNKRDVWTVGSAPFPGAHFAVYPPELIRPCILAATKPGGVVLDPFSGSGTTGMVATQEGRKYAGIDLNRDYLDLSLKTRFAQPVLNFGAIA